MRRILFVDDEPRILDALRRMLRPLRESWDMIFVSGGEAALQAFEVQAFDVVVSDMRMPGMDGAHLLYLIALRYPGTVRVVLSGHTEVEAAIRAVPVAHQFIMKPCEAATLQQVIDRACQLRDLLASPILREVVGGVDMLPPVPSAYAALGHELANPESAITDIAAIVERDSSLGAKVLHLANSAFFGPRRQISSALQATSLLGTRLIRNLVLSHEIFGAGGVLLSPALDRELEQTHALWVASLAARMIGDQRVAEDAFTAGMLHDVGKLVLASRLPDGYRANLETSRASGEPLYQVETRCHGVSHAQVGAYLLGLWGLPFPIVGAVAGHHSPTLNGALGLELTEAVHLADALVHEREIDPGLVELLGGQDRLGEWRECAARQDALQETEA